MRLMHSNTTLKNHVDLGQTQGGHFHVYTIGNRVIAKRIPTAANNTTAQINLEQFLRDNNIKAHQLDLVSPTLDGTTDPMTISQDILDEMSVKTLTVKGLLKSDCTDYKGIKVSADTIAMTTDNPSPVLENIHTNLLILRPRTDINLKVSGCNIDTLFLHPDHTVTMNSDNGIKNVTGDTGGFHLDHPNARILSNASPLRRNDGPVSTLVHWMRENPNDVTDLGHSGQWQVSQYYDYIIAKTNDFVDSKSFDDLKQFMAKNNITGPILYLDTPTQDAAMEIPRDMLDNMNVHTVIAKSMLQGDYSDKAVKIAIPNKDVVHLGKLKAHTLQLHTGPNTRRVDFTKGDDALVENLRIIPHSNITLDSPLSGAFSKVTIASPQAVTIKGENNSFKFADRITVPKVCFKDTYYQEIIKI